MGDPKPVEEKEYFVGMPEHRGNPEGETKGPVSNAGSASQSHEVTAGVATQPSPTRSDPTEDPRKDVRFLVNHKGSTSMFWVDATDVPRVVSRAPWHLHRVSGKLYVVHTQPDRRGPLYLHRVLIGVPSTLEVDHVDGDGLNNTRSNLRPVTDRQQTQNRGLLSTNTSGHRNVMWNKRKQRWRVIVAGREIGSFKSKLDAAKAARAARERMFTHTNEERHPL